MKQTLIIEGLEFKVRKSPRRRTIGISIERKGDLSVAVPDQVEVAEVEAAVRSKLLWVFGKLAEKSLLFKPGPEKEYVSGEGFCYLGRSYRLLLIDNVTSGAEESSGLRLVGGRFVMRRADQPKARELFVRWYTSHALDWVRRRVEALTPRIGKSPTVIRVRDLGNRWGSCNGDGRLNFHWKTIRLPPSLVEYIIVHELVHLKEPQHNAAFWRYVERVLPDYHERKRLLAERGTRY